MRSPEEHLKRCFNPFVFAIWSGFLIYLLAGQRYVAFLRPEFGLLLVVALVVALGFMLASILRAKASKLDLSAVLRALVLLTPVLYFMAMPDAMLDHQAFKKRFIGPHGGAIGQQAPPRLASKESAHQPDVTLTPEAFEGSQENPQGLTILDLYRKPNFYKGQRVNITGMMMRDDQLKPHFGGKDTAVYRFMIHCCVADALPLAIALDSDHTDTFVNDQWIQVEGIFDLQQIDGQPVPLISSPEINPIEAPAVPYLF